MRIPFYRWMSVVGAYYLTLTLLAASFSGCVTNLTPLSNSSQHSFEAIGQHFAISKEGKSEIWVAAYHASGSKLLFVLHFLNLDSLTATFDPQIIQAIGFNERGDSTTLPVYASSTYLKGELGFRKVGKGLAYLSRGGKESEQPFSKVDTYISLDENSIHKITLLAKQQVCGSIEVEANSQFVDKFQLRIPLGAAIHRIEFYGQ